ncbi:unnamed protein product [Brugia pahangi]|uniref:Uncharacterized protein n=1 Tax=Brugia pahangi TaxID=6280 RepID=A0A0N4TKM5_BRUPA|nr:unnamed protein product [Brugia pahangi]
MNAKMKPLMRKKQMWKLIPENKKFLSEKRKVNEPELKNSEHVIYGRSMCEKEKKRGKEKDM